MTIQEIFEGSYFYRRVIEKGQASMLLLMLTDRFGVLPDGVKAQVLGADQASIERWAIQFLSETSLEECLR